MNSEGCIFKILPRYKVRSVGDEVRYNDQAKFESVRTEGQFLHCSSRCYRNKFPVFEQWFVHACMHGAKIVRSLILTRAFYPS